MSLFNVKDFTVAQLYTSMMIHVFNDLGSTPVYVHKLICMFSFFFPLIYIKVHEIHLLLFFMIL